MVYAPQRKRETKLPFAYKSIHFLHISLPHHEPPLNTLTTATRRPVAVSLDAEYRAGWRAIERPRMRRVWACCSQVSLSVSCKICPLSGHHMFLGKPEVLGSMKRCREDRVMELEVENSRLRRLVAELLLRNQQLRDANLPSQSARIHFDQNRNRSFSE